MCLGKTRDPCRLVPVISVSLCGDIRWLALIGPRSSACSAPARSLERGKRESFFVQRPASLIAISANGAVGRSSRCGRFRPPQVLED